MRETRKMGVSPGFARRRRGLDERLEKHVVPCGALEQRAIVVSQQPRRCPPKLVLRNEAWRDAPIWTLRSRAETAFCGDKPRQSKANGVVSRSGFGRGVHAAVPGENELAQSRRLGDCGLGRRSQAFAQLDAWRRLDIAMNCSHVVDRRRGQL